MEQNRQHSVFPFLPLAFKFYRHFVVSNYNQREGPMMFLLKVFEFLGRLKIVSANSFLDEFASRRTQGSTDGFRGRQQGLSRQV